MPTHLLSKLSIFLIILSLPDFLPPTKSIFCPLIAWGSERDFGRDGQDGNSGRAGKSGRNGDSQTISADGESVNLELSGEDGQDADDGDDGDDAFCGRQPQDVERNLRAANGGDGGRGGNGGKGGDGGSLTVYYSNPADLRKILVRANGGEGGRAGRGGNAGYGCECRRERWEVKTCTGTPGSPDYKCKNLTFNCTDGRDGSRGSNGSDGSKGRLGSLTLINRKEPLAEDAPTLKVAMSELKDQVFQLSKNKWDIRTGATSLLAPGSVMNNEYREFDRRLESSFQVVWNEPQPISSFSDEKVSINLEDNQQIKVDFPKDVWVKGEELKENNLTKFVVSNAIRKSDATKLQLAEFAGSGSNLQLSLVDLGGKSDLVSTQFYIKYLSTPPDARFNRFNVSISDFRTRYEGKVPAELVSRQKNRFTINIGKLPISAEYLQTGIPVDIEIVANRSLGDRSANQKINYQGEIAR